MSKLFRVPIREPESATGVSECLLNLEQVVFLMVNPYDSDTCLIRMTGEANVFMVMAPFADVRATMEEVGERA